MTTFLRRIFEALVIILIGLGSTQIFACGKIRTITESRNRGSFMGYQTLGLTRSHLTTNSQNAQTSTAISSVIAPKLMTANTKMSVAGLGMCFW